MSLDFYIGSIYDDISRGDDNLSVIPQTPPTRLSSYVMPSSQHFPS